LLVRNISLSDLLLFICVLLYAYSHHRPVFRRIETNLGKAQILATIFIAEVASEAQGKHYMKGGDFPTMVFPPIDFSGVSKDVLDVKRSRELNNGRLAQIAILSFIAEHNIHGSVPVLSGIEAFH